LPGAFGLNYPEFPDSCLRFEFSLLVDVADMLVDGPNILLKELGHELLRQPDRFVFKPDLDPRAAVLSLVDQDFGARWGGGDISVSRLSQVSRLVKKLAARTLRDHFLIRAAGCIMSVHPLCTGSPRAWSLKALCRSPLKALEARTVSPRTVLKKVR
jgi:hypothetical protein